MTLLPKVRELYRCIDSRFDDDVYLIPVWLEDCEMPGNLFLTQERAG